MKALKAFFLSRLVTEKILLAGFLLIIAVWGVLKVGKDTVAFARSFRDAVSNVSEQQQWLDRQPEIEQESKKAIAQLDRSKTLDSGQLQGSLNTLAVNLPNTSIEPRPDVVTDQFTQHSVQFTVRKVDWKTLEDFYVQLSKRSPYITIEQCSISADRINPTNDPNNLNATMLVSSVEIAQ